MSEDLVPRPVRSFGRTRSRTLKAAQAQRLESRLPGLAIAPGTAADFISDVGSAPLFLEIGFGGGEHLAAQAAARPEASFIGAEPFQNGVASLIGHLEARAARNVRIYPGDARALIPELPKGRFQGVYVLFPDPWPKLRHHKRRLLKPETILALSELLAPGGFLRFATDWADYAEAALLVLLGEPRLAWTAGAAADWRLPPAGHVRTRYEAKGLGDIRPMFFEFTRRVPGEDRAIPPSP